MMTDQDKRRIVIKRLQKARRNEMTCLAYWEIEILLNYIGELKERTEDHEQIDNYRKPDARP